MFDIGPARLPALTVSALPARLGQQERLPTPGEIRKTAAVGGLLGTAMGGAAAWVGIRTGVKESGFLSVAGWVVGVAGSVMGALSLFGSASVLMTSEERLQEAIREAERQQLPKATSPAPMPAEEF